MAGKKALGTLKPVTAPKPIVEVREEERIRGTVQTVRMDLKTLEALQLARIKRHMSQNDIMLLAIRKDLGLE